ncbi:alpha/beta fold hydrolase [Gammaproteobacteria bacterium LSUCC0057]|uniref:Alpha/beta fold hydrolase n=1 Tax=Gammaproteobacteria bacterium LSUCC0057 TaxID=2559237 RepID=A0A4Y8UG54_9GAMM|nr:alpha/beta fold hydrolase [Gammaproteobacteria bacterium LSUCC0057]
MADTTALRTPDEAFAGLPDYSFTPHYLDQLPALNGLRLHYIDEGPRDAEVVWLLLHGNPAWSYLWRHWVPVLVAEGHRVVAPDLIGFGKSDKPIQDSCHHYDFHRQVLVEFVEQLQLGNIHLAVQDWGGLFGLTLPMAAPARYSALLVMNTALATGDKPLSDGFVAWRQFNRDKPSFSLAGLFQRSVPHLSAEEAAAYAAPFPTEAYRAAIRRFPEMVMDSPEAEGAATSRQALQFWRQQWQGRTAMAIGAADPVLGPPVMQALAKVLGCQQPLQLTEGGHFLQEWAHPQLNYVTAAMPQGLVQWAIDQLVE